MRKTLVLALSLALVCGGLGVATANTYPLSGTKCKNQNQLTIGLNKNSGKIILICKKSAKGWNWQPYVDPKSKTNANSTTASANLNSQSSNSSATSTNSSSNNTSTNSTNSGNSTNANSGGNSTPAALPVYPETAGNPNPPTYPETDASRFVDQLVANLDLSKSTNQTKIATYIEDGKNGPYVDIAVKGVQEALNFYSVLGFNITAPRFYLVLGRTQQWSADQVNQINPCMGNNLQFNGGFTICPSPTNPPLVYTNLVNGTIHTPNPDTNADLTHVIETSDWAADFAHETFHVAQHTKTPRLDDPIFPLWVNEGSAQFFGYMVGAKLSNGALTYNQELEKYLDWSHNVQQQCSTKIEDIQSPCNYTLGLFVVEFFIYKYGFDGFNRLINEQTGSTFEEVFKNATGDNLADFYQQANAEVKARGW